MALLELIKTWQLSHQCNGLSLSSVGSYSPHLTLLWPAGTPLVSLRLESGFYSVVPHRSHIGDPHSSHFDFSSFELPLNLVHLFNDRKLEILRETYRSYAIAPERCKTFIQLFDCFPNGFCSKLDFKPSLVYDPRSVALLRGNMTRPSHK